MNREIIVTKKLITQAKWWGYDYTSQPIIAGCSTDTYFTRATLCKNGQNFCHRIAPKTRQKNCSPRSCASETRHHGAIFLGVTKRIRNDKDWAAMRKIMACIVLLCGLFTMPTSRGFHASQVCRRALSYYLPRTLCPTRYNLNSSEFDDNALAMAIVCRRSLL